MFKVLSICKVTKFVYLKTGEGQFFEISSILFCCSQSRAESGAGEIIFVPRSCF